MWVVIREHLRIYAINDAATISERKERKKISSLKQTTFYQLYGTPEF